MANAAINGININYQVTGEGVPLVLIHGHPFDHTMWQPQVDDLSKSFKVITPDLRGYGKSTLPERNTTRFEDYAADVLRLMDRLAIESFHLGGLSMGGQVIMEIFRQAPEKIKSLIFADTFAGPDTPEIKQGRYDTADRLEKEGMDAYADEVIYKMIRPEHVSFMPEVAGHIIRMMKASSPEGAAAALRARANRINYLATVLPEINVPALVIVGRQDEFTPVNKAEELQANLNHCKLVIIEDAGHMPNLEHPAIFNQAVRSFLDGINDGQSRSF